MIDFDLHVHTAPTSTCAKQTVQQAVSTAYNAGIRILAICDHNKVDALNEAKTLCDKYGIKLIRGAEFSAAVEGVSPTVDGRIVHILGLGLSQDEKILNDENQQWHALYVERMHAMCQYLKKNNYGVADVDSLKELRIQLAEKKYFPNEDEAKDWLRSHIVPLFPSQTRTMKQAVDLIHNMGGKAILAHPNRCQHHLLNTIAETNMILDNLIAQGLDGIEVFHPDTLNEQGVVDNLLQIAEKHNLIVSLGSDRHKCDDSYGPHYFSAIDKMQRYTAEIEKARTYWQKF